MPVYAAGEARIVGAGAKDLAQSIRRLGLCLVLTQRLNLNK